MRSLSRFVENLGRGVVFLAVSVVYLLALGYVGWQFALAALAGSLLPAILFGLVLVGLLIVLYLVLTS